MPEWYHCVSSSWMSPAKQKHEITCLYTFWYPCNTRYIPRYRCGARNLAQPRTAAALILACDRMYCTGFIRQSRRFILQAYQPARPGASTLVCATPPHVHPTHHGPTHHMALSHMLKKVNKKLASGVDSFLVQIRSYVFDTVRSTVPKVCTSRPWKYLCVPVPSKSLCFEESSNLPHA